MLRGYYGPRDDKRHLIPKLRRRCRPLGRHAHKAWKAIAERPFIAGGFVWTGFDYHGEPTPYEWPSNSSVFGIMDLCGFERPPSTSTRRSGCTTAPCSPSYRTGTG